MTLDLPQTMTAPSKPHALIAPIDMSRVHNEKGVKAKIKQLLDFHGYFHWMPAANGYGTQGVSDHIALKSGVLIVIEAKFGSNKPKPMQCIFAGHIIANDAYAFCVNEKNIDHLAYFLESFEIATQANGQGVEVPPEHGARMLNAIVALTEPFGLKPVVPGE